MIKCVQIIYFSFFLFRATLVAYRSSWAGGQIRAAAVGLHHSLWQCWILNPLSEARNWTCIHTETTSGSEPAEPQGELLFLPDSVLVGYMSLESCPFLLGCQICYHIIVLLLFLYFCSISWDFSFFISYFIWAPSLLMSLASSLSILLTLSRSSSCF